MNNFDASLYMKESKKHPILSRDDELKLGRLAMAGNKKAQQKLVSSNLRFVIKVAHTFKTYCNGKSGITFDDLVQAGNEGLIKAAEKFDPGRGFKFITYAVWWVKAYMQNYVRENFSLIKIGTTQSQRALFTRQRKIKAIADLDADDRDEARKAIAKEAKVTVADVLHMEERFSNYEVLLHNPIIKGDDGGMTYEEVIGKENDLDERIHSKQVSNFVRHALDSEELTEREKYILRQRFFEGVTLREIGTEQGVSRERIRQVEAKALQKLGAVLENMGVTKHDIP
jgi:RNA polymerase sigma-32 factor